MVVPALLLAACSSPPSVTTGSAARERASRRLAPTAAPEALYPLSGTADYDVERYDVDLTYDPATTAISAYAVMTAVAATPLTTLTVDLGPLAVDGANVDNVPVTAVQQAGRQDPPHLGRADRAGHAGSPSPSPTTGCPSAAPTAPSGRRWAGSARRRAATRGTSRTEPAPGCPTNDRPGDKAVTRIRVDRARPVLRGGQRRAGGGGPHGARPGVDDLGHGAADGAVRGGGGDRAARPRRRRHARRASP